MQTKLQTRAINIYVTNMSKNIRLHNYTTECFRRVPLGSQKQKLS